MAFNNPKWRRFINAQLLKHVEPVAGSIVYCKLLGLPNRIIGTPDHTGIYVGNKRIIELNGNEKIIEVDYYNFLNSSSVRSGTEFYVACDARGNVLHDPAIAKRAIAAKNTHNGYNLIRNNCHMFTSRCIKGSNNDPLDATFMNVERNIKKHFGVSVISWRIVKQRIF
ncbi:hypothetical protein JFL43_08950 [Viridibacillus sp. YIM B01967]|uniref:LRAT domain-containing protein n=1 Tax=Viridibacillus soli TaxID=2798301 RepID=A0ABS1H6F6_9BACL|nr:hypothetical protein [Viridibacillus soli]MBK3494986.1 hypothetical protein [Viridibacillus soli]